MLFSACGKKASENKPRVVASRNVTLTLPQGTAGDVSLGVTGFGAVPTSLARVASRAAEYVVTVGGVEFKRTDTTPLPGPATLAFELAPNTLPAGRNPSSVFVVALDPGGTLSTLVPTVAGNQLTVSLPHLAAVLFVVTRPELPLLGTPGLVLGGTSKILADVECARWIAPESPQTAALAKDPAKFSIDDKQTLRLDPPLTITEIDESGQSRTSDEILKRGSGDAINASVVYGSLLAAKGYRVRLVGGLATYKVGELARKGFHQWAEVLIDGAPYYVETLDGPPHLVPAAQAREQRKLETYRACSKIPAGATDDPFAAVDAPR